MGILVDSRIKELQAMQAAKRKLQANLDALFMAVHKADEKILTKEFIIETNKVILSLTENFEKIKL